MPDFLPGQVLSAADLRTFGSPLEPYTPDLVAATTNPNLGSGAIRMGTWSRQGELCVGRFYVRFGTSGVNPGAGEYYMSLPVPVAVGGFPRVVLGSGWIRDANATFPAGVAPIVIDLALGTDPTGSVARFIVESTQTVRSSGPWTWAAGDELMGEFSYPAIWPN